MPSRHVPVRAAPPTSGALRIDRVVTSGMFTVAGRTRVVSNNVWLLGDDRQVLIIDPAHDVDAIRAAAGDREVCAIACTHGHHDHVNVAPQLARKLAAPVLLHPADLPLWRQTHPDRVPDGALVQDEVMRVSTVEVRVLGTPGHTLGSVSLYVPALELVFTGDTLLNGGQGATGQPGSDFPAIISSIRDRLLSLPPQTRVLPGHGPGSTVRDEARHLGDRLARGH